MFKPNPSHQRENSIDTPSLCFIWRIYTSKCLKNLKLEYYMLSTFYYVQIVWYLTMVEVNWLLLINALLIFLIIGNKVALRDGATEIGSTENSQHGVRKDARKGKLSLIHSEKENYLVFCHVIFTVNMCTE